MPVTAEILTEFLPDYCSLLSPREAVTLGGTIEPLVPDLWVPSFSIVTGQPGHGKSMLALMMADALRAGADFLGRPVRKGEHFIAYAGMDPDALAENGERAMRLPNAGYDNLAFLSEPLPAPDDRSSWNRLIGQLHKQGVTELIIDNFTRLVQGADTNTLPGVNATLDRCLDVGRAGIPVLLLAHSATPGNFGAPTRPMGHQAINAASRLTINIAERGRSGDLYAIKTNKTSRTPRIELLIQVDHIHMTAEVVSEVKITESARPRQRDMDKRRRQARQVWVASTADDRRNQSTFGRTAGSVLGITDGRGWVKHTIQVGIYEIGADGREVVQGPYFEGPPT